MTETGLGYTAALTGAAFYVQPQGGYLRIGGEDRAAFLQRQSSNDVRRLAPGRAVLTVLTSPLARIIDVLCLLDEGEAIGMLTLPGQAEATHRFLRSRIFFMDKVSVEQASAGLAQIELLGPQADRVAARLGCQRLPEAGEVLGLQFAGTDLRLVGQASEIGLGCLLLAPPAAQASVLQALAEAGAAPLLGDEMRLLRVEAGLPSAGFELTEAFTPLESGLAQAVSDSKGCYAGQEVLARQVTYDKVVQRLCGLRLEAAVDPGARLQAEDGHPAGVVTSAVYSPRFGPIALAVLRRPNDQPGIRLRVGEAAIGAEVTPPGVWEVFPGSARAGSR